MNKNTELKIIYAVIVINKNTNNRAKGWYTTWHSEYLEAKEHRDYHYVSLIDDKYKVIIKEYRSLADIFWCDVGALIS